MHQNSQVPLKRGGCHRTTLDIRYAPAIPLCQATLDTAAAGASVGGKRGIAANMMVMAFSSDQLQVAKIVQEFANEPDR